MTLCLHGESAGAPKGDAQFRVTVAMYATFALASGLLIWLHEPWRDEIETWAWGASSANLSDLLRHIRYDPNPPLWFLILFLASRFSSSLVALKVVNFMTSLFCGGVIATTWSLRSWERAAMLGSYFILFEYGAISRPYALIAGCTLLLARWAAGRQNVPAAGGLYLIAALSSIYGTIAALPAALLTLVRSRERWRTVVGGLVLLTAALVGGRLLLLPADFEFGSVTEGSVSLAHRAGAVGAALAGAFCPIPRPALHFWNTSLLPEALLAPIGFVLFVLATISLRRSRPALIQWLGSALLLQTFASLSGSNAARHQGFLFVAYVGAVIIARIEDPQIARWFLGVVLVLQCAGTSVAAWIDGTQPFSRIEETAAFIRSSVPASALVVGLPDTVTAPVAFLAERDFFFANGLRYGRTVTWDHARRELQPNALLNEVTEARAVGRRVFVVTNRSLAIRGLTLRAMATFTPSIVANESFVIYEVVEPRYAPGSGLKSKVPTPASLGPF